MVEVEFESIKKIVVHEVIKHPIKTFVKNRVVGLPKGVLAPPFLWAEGVLFSRSVMPPTDEVVKQQLAGILHLTAIEWALMPKFKKSLRLAGVTIPVIDVSANPTLSKIIRELKKTYKET